MNPINKLGGKAADIYRRLIVCDIRNLLGCELSLTSLPPSTHEYSILISRAGMLALSEHGVEKNLAYEIVARIIEVAGFKNDSMTDAISFILTRLGNFPAKQLIADKQTTEHARLNKLPITLAIEDLAHKQSNSIEINSGEQVLLTDFQILLYDRISEYRAVSFSAPTSAGKSFLLGLDLVRRLKIRGKKSIVFVVPTRALIRQVAIDINKVVRESKLQIPVVCIPEIFDEDEFSTGVVYVLTQERLLNLLQSHEGAPFLTALFVDEAHEVQSGTRGMLLQAVIDKAISLFPTIELLFSSPLRSNPGFLLELFNQSHEGTFFVEESSPVTQNLLSLTDVPGKPKSLDVSLISEVGTVNIGTVDFGFSFRGSKKVALANLAKKLTKDKESSIVYANGPSEAEALAKLIAADLIDEPKPSQRINDLISFIRSELHHLHPLIPLLRKKCAFHYGHLPHIVRGEIEDLVREGEIKFLTCTSTLLQGVNLPVKNIFIWSPKKGNQSPMKKGDFWNLAGRAGRLTKEFHGNVWCVNVKDWEENPFIGDKTVEMSSALLDSYARNSADIRLSALDVNRPSENKSTKSADYAFAVGFANYTLMGESLLRPSFSFSNNQQNLLDIDEYNLALAEKIRRIPSYIFQRNPGVSPHRIVEIYVMFEENEEHIEHFLPLFPLAENAYDRTLKIFEILNIVFFKTNGESYKYFAWLANEWMRGTSLKALITSTLKRESTRLDPDEISKSIEKLLDNLESGIRFRHVKYARVYCETLNCFLLETGKSHLTLQSAPLHFYLEHGAAKPVLINLMALGISRASALELQKALNLKSSFTRAECHRALKGQRLGDLGMPALCIREVTSLLGF